ncbi:hypothetical protein HMPREF9628_01101 [Peptoanaerobacter stomatis]|uniref:NAD-dependent epimerase/dehydratase domain-containing protein n=1 Tax=Peptoanaerobacter stomatis TaxID=796937 RepID=G9XAT4_9FIRM|nr:NAD(P)-dependent oxidoreductase [Peptoanaerobacter stomatis]EHL19928.1 hypothetical protein HMPREF9628_01101 [Peptoanaerobacter stomatis]
MKRAIITGATGAIGTALIRELIKNNIEVLVLCRKNSSRINNIIKNHLVKIKYCSLDEFKNIDNTDGEKYDVFYHLAWESTIGEGRNDVFMQNRNIEFSLDAVNLAYKFGCDTFIGAGSQAEYGRHNIQLTSKTSTFPENAYGVAKLCSSYMTRYLANKLGMKHIWVRILSVYGPNDSDKTMIMSLINKLINKESFNCTKGEQIWDYLHSYDAARAFYTIGNKPIDGKIYVLGSGEKRYLKDYINDVKNLIDKNAVINFGAVDYAMNQVMYLTADNSDLYNDLGWKADIKFIDGIKIIINELKSSYIKEK